MQKIFLFFLKAKDGVFSDKQYWIPEEFTYNPQALG